MSNGDCTFFELADTNGGSGGMEPSCQWSQLDDGRIEIKHSQQISFGTLKNGSLEVTQTNLDGSPLVALSREEPNASNAIITGALVTSGVNNGFGGPEPADQRTSFFVPSTVYLFVRYTDAMAGMDAFQVSLWKDGVQQGNACSQNASGGDLHYNFWCSWSMAIPGSYEFRLYLNNEQQGSYPFFVSSVNVPH